MSIVLAFQHGAITPGFASALPTARGSVLFEKLRECRAKLPMPPIARWMSARGHTLRPRRVVRASTQVNGTDIRIHGMSLPRQLPRAAIMPPLMIRYRTVLDREASLMEGGRADAEEKDAGRADAPHDHDFCSWYKPASGKAGMRECVRVRCSHR